MIKQMKYPGYFLIVWDFIRYAREQGIPVGPGRGSAAGSLVAYCMRITDVDPIDFDLIFERFLNPERVSLPDIDIDFCERRRGEVIDYVTRKYGRENVAQIITFGTMKAKAVVRDVGRVLEMPFADVDKVAKQIPAALDMTLDKALEESEPLRQMEQNDPKVKELLSVARRLEGMTRHASVHAAGVVIAPQAITEYAPLYKGAHDEIVTQWSMKEIERVGLLKMDFLGLEHADADLRRHRGDQADDRRRRSTSTTSRSTMQKTYQIFQDGQTYGIFQFEIERHARHPAQVEAAAPRGPDRAERALPARPAPQRHGRRLHRAQAGKDRDQVRAAAARADPRRHLRRHRLPGTGDAHLERRRRLHARRGRPAAQGDGEEERRGHGEDARQVRRGRRRRTGTPRRRPRTSST